MQKLIVHKQWPIIRKNRVLNSHTVINNLESKDQNNNKNHYKTKTNVNISDTFNMTSSDKKI